MDTAAHSPTALQAKSRGRGLARAVALEVCPSCGQRLRNQTAVRRLRLRDRDTERRLERAAKENASLKAQLQAHRWAVEQAVEAARADMQPLEEWGGIP